MDVFWEAIQKAQVENPDESIVVSSIRLGVHPAVTIRINGFIFEVNYGCCEQFVRRMYVT